MRSLSLCGTLLLISACIAGPNQTASSGDSGATGLDATGGPAPSQSDGGGSDAGGESGAMPTGDANAADHTDGSSGASSGGAGSGSGGGPGPGSCTCACGQISLFGVVGAGGDGGGGVVSELSVTVSGVDASSSASTNVQCRRDPVHPCQYQCEFTSGSIVPSGTYTFSVSAPGYRTATVDVAVTVGCGCCGCCGYVAMPQTVTLQPDGSAVTGCCADLTSDFANCGACGHKCPGGWPVCNAGTCSPAFSACIDKTSGVKNCDAYCASQGQTCTTGCSGVAGASIASWAIPGCPNSSLVHYATDPGGTSIACSGDLTWDNDSGTPSSYRCCCTSH